jgi:hypothetical protein
MSAGTAPVYPGPNTQTVRILEETIGYKLSAFVDTPIVKIGSGSSRLQQVQWINGTHGKATLWFPNGAEVFDETMSPGRDFSKLIDIPAGGLTLTVKASPAQDDYHYHIYCEVTKDCARGNSEPQVTCP